MNLSVENSLLKPLSVLCVAALLVAPFAALSEVVTDQVTEKVEDQGTDELAAAYQDWISALESTNSNDSAWEFPFDAPRPGQLSAQEMKTVLALRRLVQSRDSEKLATQAEIIARSQEEIPVQLRFWLAYAQSTLHRNEACLGNLQVLLQVPEGHFLLEPGQRAWVLTALADHSFLLDERERAAGLYGQLAASSVEQLNLWGQYQLAGIEFLERNFADANRRYKVVCESEKSGTWREHACAMAEIAGRLSSLNLKGETHGDVTVVSP